MQNRSWLAPAGGSVTCGVGVHPVTLGSTRERMRSGCGQEVDGRVEHRGYTRRDENSRRTGRRRPRTVSRFSSLRSRGHQRRGNGFELGEQLGELGGREGVVPGAARDAGSPECVDRCWRRPSVSGSGRQSLGVDDERLGLQGRQRRVPSRQTWKPRRPRPCRRPLRTRSARRTPEDSRSMIHISRPTNTDNCSRPVPPLGLLLVTGTRQAGTGSPCSLAYAARQAEAQKPIVWRTRSPNDQTIQRA